MTKRERERTRCGVLRGMSGLGVCGLFHLNAPYSCNGLIFVEWSHRRHGETWRGWKRMTEGRAKKEGREIIMCVKRGCKRPAAMIDHHYPYMAYDNLCEIHAKEAS